MKRTTNEDLKRNSIYEYETNVGDYLFFKEDGQLLDVPSYHKCLEIIYMIEGNAKAIISGREYAFNPGDFCFINPYEVHYYETLSEKVKVMILLPGHAYTYPYEFKYEGKSMSNILRNKEKNEKLYKILNSWLTSTNRSFLNDCANVNLFFDTLVKEYDFEDDISKDKILSRKFLDYLELNYKEDLSLDNVSRYFGYTKEYFCKLFHDLIGDSYHSILNHIRLSHTIDMIVENKNDLSIEEISRACGYKSLSTFYRQYYKYIKERKTN